MERQDETAKMQEMSRWLAAVSEELGVEENIIEAHQNSLLRLIGKVAHGPSRPGAPLSAFLVGFAAASQQQDPEELIARVEELAKTWDCVEVSEPKRATQSW